MKNNSLLPLCIAILLCFCFAQCKKTKIEPTELSKLPAATQIGANTFGCLVNGKAWIAQTDCKFLCDAPFKITYDAGGGGNIAVTGKFINNDLNTDQTLSFGIDSTNFKNIFDYELLGDAHVGFTYINSKIFNNCRYLLSIDSLTNASGIIHLTRYDLSNGIFSGTFNFNITKPGCETITVTEGRFDKKL